MASECCHRRCAQRADSVSAVPLNIGLSTTRAMARRNPLVPIRPIAWAMSATGSSARACALLAMRITSATRCGSRITRSASAAVDWPSSRRLLSNCGMTAGARGSSAERESSEPSTASRCASNRRSLSCKVSEGGATAPITHSKNGWRKSTAALAASSAAAPPATKAASASRLGGGATGDAMRTASGDAVRPPNSAPTRCFQPLICCL